MTIKAIFDGFDTIEQAKAFIDWYIEYGEQSIGLYLEEATDLSLVNIKNIYVNLDSSYTYTEDSVTCNLELYCKL